MYGDLMARPMAEIAGANARALRLEAAATLENFARAVTSYGLPWSTGRVGDFESGRAAPSLATLFAVTAALSDVIGRPVRQAELFAGEGEVAINDRLTVPLSVLRAALTGGPVHFVEPVHFAGTGTLTAGVVAVQGTLRESDMRMCKSIGVDLGIGVAAMVKLWGRPFSAERDHRAEPGANAQRKGQISRALKTELRAELQKVANDGDN
jgi:hypothetical protein